MKAVIVTAKGVQDQEYIYPRYRLEEAGYEVEVAIRGGQPTVGILGLPVEPTRDVAGIFPADYDLLVIPGGVKSMERMRLDEELVNFVRDFHASGRVVASMCSGAQLLISAGLVRWRVVSAYPAMRVDVENAGGRFHPGPVVDFDRIVSSPHYRHLGPWMRAALDAVERERRLAIEHA